MKIDSRRDEAVIKVFLEPSRYEVNPVGLQLPYRTDWYQARIKALAEYEFNEIDEHKLLLKRNKFWVEKVRDTISINKYKIITLVDLYRNSVILSEELNDEADWSHPLALYIHYHLDRFKEMKLDVQYGLEEGTFYATLRRFINMTYGMVNKQHSNGDRDREALRVKTPAFTDIVNGMSKIITENVIDHLDVRHGDAGHLVAVDIDYILVSGTDVQIVKDRMAENDKKYVDISEDLKMLNVICRKLKIDIVK